MMGAASGAVPHIGGNSGMEHIWLPVLGLMLVLTLAVLLLPVANRLNFPHTVLLAVAGMAIGWLATYAGAVPAGPAGDALLALSNLHITADMVFFVFLPTLVFESALSIDVRRLLDDVGAIIFLAVIGLLISTFAIGLALWWSSPMALVVCLLLGCIVSATDPVAVVALFRELGAPKRLTILVEGESLFNDATAIVLFSILLAMVTGAGELDLLDGAWDFLRVFIGGVLVGFIIARAYTFVIGRLRKLTLVCITLTITLAYLSFLIAEHYLHVSGVMAVVTAGLVVGSTGRTVIPPSGFHALHETWGQLGFWANSIIFVLVGLAIPDLLAAAHSGQILYLAAVIAAAFVARVAVIFALMPLLARFGIGHRVSGAFRTVMVWGGLRGAVSLALALAIVENTAVDAETRQFISVLVTGFVMFTLFVQATTIRSVMAWLGLDQLAPADRALRERAVAQTMLDVSQHVGRAMTAQGLDVAVGHDLRASYDTRADEAEEKAKGIEGLSEEDWVAVGLATTIAQEKHRYFAQFGDGFISAAVLRELLVRTEDISDALRTRGLAGYEGGLERSLAFHRQFYLAMAMQRRFGMSRLLSNALRLRFEMLLAMCAAIREEVTAGEGAVRDMVGAAAGARVVALLKRRLEAATLQLASIRLQYPDYARTVEERQLGRVALSLEERDYEELLEQALISQDVFDDLMGDIEARRRHLEERPPLDLGLEPARLVRQVPFLSHLSDERLAGIAAILRPVLTVPGEKIVSRGEPGDAMYFVSSGSLLVDLGTEHVQLGNGDLFGEIALLAERPRTADVTSLGFCQLLMLHRRDFLPLLEANADLKAHIEAIAKERLTGL